MSSTRRRGSAAGACVLIMSAALAADQAPKLEVGKPAPEFKVTQIGGDRKEPLTLADFKGQTLILEFWATWCGPCHEAREQLTLLHKEFADRGVRILAVSCEEPDVVRAFMKKHPVPYLVGTDTTKAIVRAYGGGGLPSSVVIDKEGKILYGIGGVPFRQTMLDYLDRGIVHQRTAPTTQPAAKQSQTVLRLEISKSRNVPKHSGNYGWGYSKNRIEFQSFEATIESILGQLLDVSVMRIVRDKSVASERWNIQFVHEPLNGGKPDLGILIDALCREAGIQVQEVDEERDVLVARHTDENPPRGGGVGYVYDEKAKKGTHLNVTMADLFKGYEDKISIPIVDETGLEGGYRLELPYEKDGIEQAKATLATKYGITLKPERRMVRFYHVTPTGPATQPAG